MERHAGDGAAAALVRVSGRYVLQGERGGGRAGEREGRRGGKGAGWWIGGAAGRGWGADVGRRREL
jgi:hypothetical protein